MHFVKKTTFTEQELKAQELENAEKVTAFVAARNALFDKRKQENFDAEARELSRELLIDGMPDMYTVWNIRRQVLQHMRQRNENESDDAYSNRLASLFDEELKLTKEALFENPKSYSAWNQRFWAFNEHPRADLAGELKLCEIALQMDCRNFHCWDHRRAVAALANLSASEELQFSDRLVLQNPSNYSAWHYRATLLPKIPANQTDCERMMINENCIVDEMEKVKTVCCVNSEDQTAWTYCRWLTELASETALINNIHEGVISAQHVPQILTVSTIDYDDDGAMQAAGEDDIVTKDGRRRIFILFVLDTPVQRSTLLNFLVSQKTREDVVSMQPFSPFRSATSTITPFQYARVWLVEFCHDAEKEHTIFSLEIFVRFPRQQQEKGARNNDADTRTLSFCFDRERRGDGTKSSFPFVNDEALKKIFSPYPLCRSAKCREALAGLETMCQNLVREGDNVPWEHTALARVHVFLTGCNTKTLKIAEESLDKAKIVDLQRSSMYDELADKLRIVVALNNDGQLDALWNSRRDQSPFAFSLAFRNLKLNSLNALHPLTGIITILNLQGNRFSDLKRLAGQFQPFGACLTHLTLDENPIDGLPAELALALPRLRFLSLAGTCLSEAEALRGYAKHCPLTLERLVLCETPLVVSAGTDQAIMEKTVALFRNRGRSPNGVRLLFYWL